MATRVYRTSAPGRGRSRWFGLAGLLTAPVGWMVIFYLIPIGILLVHALWSVKYPEIDHTLTVKNFRTILSSELYPRVFVRTVIMAAGVTLADIVLAFPLAFWLAKRVRRNRDLLLFLVIFPLWSSYLIRIFAWNTLLGTNGILNSFL